MKKFNYVFCFAVIFTLNFNYYVNGVCNVCGALTGIACVSQTSYSVCAANVPDLAQLGNCAAGTVCNSDTVQICTAAGPASCIPVTTCKQCSIDNRYACISTNTYQLCFGTTTSSGTIFTCPIGQVCDYTVGAPSFCRDSTLVPSPICAAPITIASTSVDPMAWCKTLGTVGKYKVKSDTTCKAYVNCYSSFGLLTGAFYSCPGTSIFNSALHLCVDPATYTCV